MAAQDIMNQENGGLKDSSLALFINNDPGFTDRGRLDVRFEDAENKLEGIRFYGDHYYELISDRDSLGYSVLTLGNVLSYERKYFRYNQARAFAPFGPSYVASDLYTRTRMEDFNLRGFVDYDNSLLGKITA